MTYEYSAQNHDWDLTLQAAGDLLKLGAGLEQINAQDMKSKIFACYSGSMLLSFSAIESFSNSVAFSMPQSEKFEAFDYENYKKTRRFWEKLSLLSSAIGEEIDKSEGLFQNIAEMQNWRNLVTHSSPYQIDSVKIENTVKDPKTLNMPYKSRQYTSRVNFDYAKKFYSTAVEYIEFMKSKTGLNPRATVIYKPE